MSDFTHLEKNDLPHIVTKCAPYVTAHLATVAGAQATGEASSDAHSKMVRTKNVVANLRHRAANASTFAQQRTLTEQADALGPEVERDERNYAAAKAGHEQQLAQLEHYAFLGRCNEYLGEHRFARLHAGAKPLVRVTPPKVTSKTPLADLQQRVWPEIEAFGPKIDAARLAPVPVKTQIERAMADLDQRAERGKPDYDPRVRDKSPVYLDRALGQHGIADFMAFLHRDAIADRLRQMIGTKDAPGAMSDADRERAIAKLEAEKLQLERVEEALIVAAEAQGQRIPRRRDASPLAVLEIE